MDAQTAPRRQPGHSGHYKYLMVFETIQGFPALSAWRPAPSGIQPWLTLESCCSSWTSGVKLAAAWPARLSADCQGCPPGPTRSSVTDQSQSKSLELQVQ